MIDRRTAKALFAAVRKHENNTARELFKIHPQLVHATGVAPPKKDDGQSPLQIACKTGNFEIAQLLIDLGADVSFQETSSINEWTAPVLHDAIRAAVFCTASGPGIAQEDSAKSFDLLKRFLTSGADPNARDSYGNNGLHRVLLDARIRFSGDPEFPHSIANRDLEKDIGAIVRMLMLAGADPDGVHPKRESARSFAAREKALSSLLELRE